MKFIVGDKKVSLMIFISIFSMEACPQMKYELVVQRKEGHICSYHVQKKRFKRKFTFDIPEFKFQKDSNKNPQIFGLFWDKNFRWYLTPKKMYKYFLQILNPVNYAEILAPEFVGAQSEMVVWQFCHIFCQANVVITGKPSYGVVYSVFTNMAELVKVYPCPSIWMCVCVRHRVQFF